MLARPNNQPSKSKLLDAKICWLSETPLNLGTKYILRHTSSESQSRIAKIHHEIDINTLHRIEGVTEISVNAIARIQIKTASEVLVDALRHPLVEERVVHVARRLVADAHAAAARARDRLLRQKPGQAGKP